MKKMLFCIILAWAYIFPGIQLSCFAADESAGRVGIKGKTIYTGVISKTNKNGLILRYHEDSGVTLIS